MSGGTPIKFGPEWLRNIGATGDSTRPNNQNGSGPSGASGSGNLNSVAAGPNRAPTSTGLPTPLGLPVTQQSQMRVLPVTTTSSATGAAPSPLPVASGVSGTSAVRQTNTPRVFMANLRYGREEMLALYDRGAGAPEQLKYFDSLYQPRGKPPSALNASEEEQSLQHESVRGGVPNTGGVPSGSGRGRGGAVSNFGKRTAFTKAQVPSRGWSRARMPGLSSGSPDDEPATLRPWSTSNGAAGPSRTTPTEQTEWTQTKLFRNRRQVHNTNWRQSGRDEGDEWRLQEHGNRSVNDRDWPERPTQDRPQSWGSNRRPWADNQTTDENIPEWANDSAEAGAGTFDASGAFHGYSNDDSNIPRQQETSFPLARSYTHGAFTRSKTVEEGSEEWWASEKAKKLSPKRLLSNEFNKYDKTSSSESNEPSTSRAMNFDDQEIPELLKLKHLASTNISTNDSKNLYAESKTFDSLMRSEIDVGEANDDHSNFQSVMIASNNGLRQKHQNIVASTADTTQRPMHNSSNLNVSYGMQHSKSETVPIQSPEDKIAEDMFEMTLEDTNLPALNITSNMPHGTSGGLCMLQPISAVTPAMQIGIEMPGLQNQAIGIHATPHQVQSNIQNVGIQNSALNSSLGLPIGTANNGVVLLQRVMPQVMTNNPMNVAMQQHSNVMGAFQQALPVIPSPNIANSPLYMAQNNNQQLPLANGHPQNPEVPNNMYPMHGMQHGGPQQVQFSSIYRGVSTPQTTPNSSLSELWYYEDPEKNIQGPFSSKEMWNWYGAGFFSPSLMVRRACETSMRPLASYGPMPFAPMDMFPLQVNQQPALGIGDSLWSQPSTSQDGMWMQPSINRSESSVNNLPMYFWDSQPSAISSNTMLPEEIIKEMKTEDEILAQIRAPQNIPVSRISFSDDAVTSATVGITNDEDSFAKAPPIPDLTAFQKIMPPGVMQTSPLATEVKAEKELTEEIADKIQMPVETEPTSVKVPQPPNKVEPKVTKTTKTETDKAVKSKDNNGNKIKTKKTKDDKKDETLVNTEEELTKKRSVESSPSKLSKDVKPPNKKEIEKEKKELIKDGFTIVKGAEKVNKENKKKADEAKAADEAERKRKEEERIAAVEEKKKTSAAAAKKQQEQQQQKQSSEVVPKKAPWSAVATQAIATNKDGLTLTEIQKLEREKKLEQMKEQQQMMHIIAQQQAAALAREQEMQAGLGWAKKMNTNNSASNQTLAEIQSETRRQAAAATAAAVAAQALEEAQAAPVVAATHVPWGNSSIGGFWDCPNQLPKVTADPVKTEPTKPVEPVKKNKVKAPTPLSLPTTKKETTPAMEFEAWCSQALGSWSSKIDVPTFVGFLKDIESPYEVKDYVKCYLGESKDSSDFSRQFLERRSKLLRVGMVTPSDDLCSPALAINPRNNSISDYQEVKGKGKKSKKNKMMKVDARILGFSVTASEDRINVGDIDTA